MKLVLALMMVMGIAICFPALAGGETKEVCTPKVDKAGKPVNDKKTGKQAQECKKIKTHKKVEGDKVPDPAKKK
jgi:hypothetical protein